MVNFPLCRKEHAKEILGYPIEPTRVESNGYYANIRDSNRYNPVRWWGMDHG
jgi:hypothetical protein